MTNLTTFREMLAGGHPNSLGRTVEVVDLVLADRSRLKDLFDCYGSDHAVVRLRTSNALKRVEAARSDWLVAFIDPLIDKIGALDQPSAQWTLAQLFLRLDTRMSAEQRKRATALMKRNLDMHDDWIVLNHTMETLARWAAEDRRLRAWLKPRIAKLAKDPRKSVAGRAKKLALRLRD